MTILELFDGALADRRDALAYGDVSFSRLHAGARRVATKLRDLGLRRGDRISLYTENRIGFVYAYLASLRLGTIAVPTNVLYRASDLGHVLHDSEAKAVIVSPQTTEFVAALAGGYPTIDVAEVERWAGDESIPQFAADYHLQAEDVALIVYTSGTTGRSKGAMLTYGNLAMIAIQVATTWRWQTSDTLVIALPLFHIHGLCAGLGASLAVGGRIVVHERFDAQRILQALRDEKATMFFGVPTMYVRLLEHAKAGEIPKLRLYVCGSAALSAELHAQFKERFGIEILERYGATEFGFPLSNRYAGPRIAGSVGNTTPGMSAYIARPGGSEPVKPGEVGELMISGPSVFKGYWRNPEATKAAFVIDADGVRWYRSGDLARYDQEHDVFQIVGRLKELIITGGFNVYPRELEEEIEQFPGVRACAVVGQPDVVRGELPVAFIEAEADFDREGLLAALRERFASFKVPKAVHVVEKLPRNALGKIEKPRLRELLAEKAAL
jgi:malonyl-CoA/methylmalonyl-CoA synthetase